MSIEIKQVNVLDNPAPFTSEFKFEITFDCLAPGIKNELEWKLIYVGCADDDNCDQELDSVLVGPVQAPCPDASKIPEKDLLDVTVLLLTCSYGGNEFMRVGYYVMNEYPGYNNDSGMALPSPIDISKIRRNILANKPRVTRFHIDWDDNNTNNNNNNGSNDNNGKNDNNNNNNSNNNNKNKNDSNNNNVNVNDSDEKWQNNNNGTGNGNGNGNNNNKNNNENKNDLNSILDENDYRLARALDEQYSNANNNNNDNGNENGDGDEQGEEEAEEDDGDVNGNNDNNDNGNDNDEQDDDDMEMIS